MDLGSYGKINKPNNALSSSNDRLEAEINMCVHSTATFIKET